jgi:site-specific DNA recombinase
VSMNDKPKAILYVRVSTPGQAERGYSLREQAERLRVYCAEHDLEVLEVVEDAGVSGAAYVNRPGLTRVRERVAEGGVSVVLATERDRFAREPEIIYLLRKELARRGTQLRALNQQADDSPVGQLTEGMLDQIARFFRATFAEKTRDNNFKKAREGKASGSGTPPFGFRYSVDRRAVEVDPETMPTVRRIFSRVADGMSLHVVSKALKEEGVPTPGGGARWYPMSLSRMINNDAYLPHTPQDLRERGVGEGVLATLECDALYGAWVYGQHRVMLTPDEENRRKFERNPESEWVVVPVPDAGIPRETVLRARAALDSGYRPRAKARNEYELAGMLFCAECGLRLTGYSTGKDKYGRSYRYYCCQKRRKWGLDACPGGPQLRAEEAEREVLEWAEGLLEDPDAIARRMDEAILHERASIHDPVATERALAKRLSGLEAKRERLLDLAADGILGKADLTARLSAVEEERGRAEAERSRVENAASRVEEMERTKEALVDAFGMGLRLGLTWMPPRLRREIYGALGLRLSVEPTGGMHAEARVDEAAIRFSREVERYARAIQEADRRLKERAREDPPGDSSEDLERTERELARVRRELTASPTVTDTVMAEVAT